MSFKLPPDLQALTLGAQLGPIWEKLMLPTERVSTGYPILDAALKDDGVDQGGFVMPSVVVLGGGPKDGKTTLSQVIMEKWVAAGNWGLYVDFENGLKRFGKRTTLRHMGVTQGDLIKADERVEKAKRKAERWFLRGQGGRQQLYLNNKDLTPADLCQHISALRQIIPDEHLLIICDSLQKLPGPGMEKIDKIDWWLGWGERIRDEFGVVIMFVSELHRQKGAREGYKTTGTSFKGSGEIEYTADLALTLRRVKGVKGRTLRLEWNRDDESDNDGTTDIAIYELQKPRHTLVEKAIDQ